MEALFSYRGYQPVIGLEVHCQLKTHSKLFCSCSTEFGGEVNAHTCPVCLGLPGVLPVVNKLAVDSAIKFALAIGAKINQISFFARKQYFYPDIPKGYQITQSDLPYSSGGAIELPSGKRVSLTRTHLEEDAGKSIHGDEHSYIDLNRAGIPLIEIVSEPVIHDPSEAAQYLKNLRAIIRYLDISDGNMEEGSFRCDANVSMRKVGEKSLGTRCEIKNLNSFKNVERAVHYEIMRQTDLLENGISVVQATMLFDPASGKTRVMRTKEDAHDYRYIPDPDLKPLCLSKERIERIRNGLPELPQQLVDRFIADYSLSEIDARHLTSERELAEYFEKTVKFTKKGTSPKVVANWLLGEFLREINDSESSMENPPIAVKDFAELLDLISDDVISGKIAKQVFSLMVKSGKPPKAIIEENNLIQITDENIISQLIDQVLQKSKPQVDEYLSGKEKIYGYFVGQIMRISDGKVNPEKLNILLKSALNAFKLNK